MKRNSRNKIFTNSFKYDKSNKFHKNPNIRQFVKTTTDFDIEEGCGLYTIKTYETVRKLNCNYNSHRNNNESEQDISHLEQLSRKQLEYILRNIDIWHYKRIREASRFFQETHDLYLIHSFRQTLHLAKRQSRNDETIAVLMGLEALMHYYLQAGFTTETGGCLVSMLRNIHLDKAGETNTKIRTRMLHLMKILDLRASQTNKQLATILYTLTLVKVLMFHPFVQIICEKPKQNTCIVSFFQYGPWIVSMSPTIANTWHQENRYFLVSLLMDIAIGSKIVTPFRRAFDIEDIDMFGYGNDLESKMRIQLKIKNSPFFINTIENIVHGGEYEFQWPMPELEKNTKISVQFFSTNINVGYAKQYLDITKRD